MFIPYYAQMKKMFDLDFKGILKLAGSSHVLSQQQIQSTGFRYGWSGRFKSNHKRIKTSKGYTWMNKTAADKLLGYMKDKPLQVDGWWLLFGVVTVTAVD